MEGYYNYYYTYIDCPETLPAFQGSPGEIIEGNIQPSLSGVKVILDLGSDGKITTLTDESGFYRFV